METNLEKELIELVQVLKNVIPQIYNTENSIDWALWLPSIISILTFLLNIFYISFVQPKILYNSELKQSLRKESISLLKYLTKIVSFDNFDGVPTKFREYSLSILLLFEEEDPLVSEKLEDIFQMIKKRKNLKSPKNIEIWNKEFRCEVRTLRKLLATHCGGLK